tara:strand:- start:5645 stop:6685 length:1041 start_codon:yes stop_codon:yes gene_type:complete
MGRVETLGSPPLGYTLDGEVKVFELVAQPVWQEFTDGDMSNLVLPEMAEHMNMPSKMARSVSFPRKVLAWGYNGLAPGPTLECTEGDRIRVLLKNELPEPTSIHWHGLECPNPQDGAAPETHAPVLPGETHVYEFTLYQSGTLMYHSGFNVAKQDTLGLGGLLVVHPLRPEARPDREFAIMQQGWALRPGNPHPSVMGMEINFLTFNGKVAPSIPIIEVKQGQRVRIRQGNLSMLSHPIHFHGYTFKIVGTDGGPIPESAQWPAVTVSVPPGSTRDLEFVAWNPGVWRLHCHKLHHVMLDGMAEVPMGVATKGGMFTLLRVLADPGQSGPWQHPRQDEIEAKRGAK